MESVSILEMYQHSERPCNICYRLFIGDEGSSSYGTMIVIEKSEYTYHTRQRGWIHSYKSFFRIVRVVSVLRKNSTCQWKICVITNEERDLELSISKNVYIFLYITLIFNTDFEFIFDIFETTHDTLNGLIFANSYWFMKISPPAKSYIS